MYAFVPQILMNAERFLVFVRMAFVLIWLEASDVNVQWDSSTTTSYSSVMVRASLDSFLKHGHEMLFLKGLTGTISMSWCVS